MIRLLGVPSEALRGDIVQGPARVPLPELISDHLLYWADQRTGIDPDDTSMHADVSRVLFQRLAGLMEMHADFLIGQVTDDPYSLAEQAEFQRRGSVAVATSMLARLPSVEEYIQVGDKADPTELPRVCFDPGTRNLRWHVMPGAESAVLPGYVPSETPETWYDGETFFVRTNHAARATDPFKDSYADFYHTEFVPGNYRTLTPVLSGDVMTPLTPSNIVVIQTHVI